MPVGALATASLLVLAGCSTSGDPSNSPAADSDVTLEYMIWDANAVPLFEELAASFTKQNPKITVEVTAVPWDQYWTKLQTQASSNTLPDLFWINEPNFAQYATNGVIAEVGADYTPADFPEALVGSYTLDGRVLAAPMSYNTMAVWYNTAIFDAAGVAYPEASWTLDDFAATANAITEKLGDEGVFGAASGPALGQETYYNTIFAAGGHVISEDGTTSGYGDPATIEGLQVWVDLISSGAAPTVEQVNDNPIAQYFTSGKLAMMWSGGWNAKTLSTSEIADTIEVAPLPHGSSDLVTTIQGGAYAVSAGSKHLAQAQAFQSFLTSQEASEAFGKAGFGIPARLSAADTFTAAFPDWDLQTFIDQSASAAPYPVSLDTAAWNQLEVEYLTPAWTGQKPVAEAARELAEAMDAVLAEEKR
jgi:multiple sugar transport system substrate-binding protein